MSTNYNARLNDFLEKAKKYGNLSDALADRIRKDAEEIDIDLLYSIRRMDIDHEGAETIWGENKDNPYVASVFAFNKFTPEHIIEEIRERYQDDPKILMQTLIHPIKSGEQIENVLEEDIEKEYRSAFLSKRQPFIHPTITNYFVKTKPQDFADGWHFTFCDRKIAIDTVKERDDLDEVSMSRLLSNPFIENTIRDKWFDTKDYIINEIAYMSDHMRKEHYRMLAETVFEYVPETIEQLENLDFAKSDLLQMFRPDTSEKSEFFAAKNKNEYWKLGLSKNPPPAECTVDLAYRIKGDSASFTKGEIKKFMIYCCIRTNEKSINEWISENYPHLLFKYKDISKIDLDLQGKIIKKVQKDFNRFKADNVFLEKMEKWILRSNLGKEFCAEIIQYEKVCPEEQKKQMRRLLDMMCVSKTTPSFIKKTLLDFHDKRFDFLNAFGRELNNIFSDLNNIFSDSYYELLRECEDILHKNYCYSYQNYEKERLQDIIYCFAFGQANVFTPTEYSLIEQAMKNIKQKDPNMANNIEYQKTENLIKTLCEEQKIILFEKEDSKFLTGNDVTFLFGEKMINAESIMLSYEKSTKSLSNKIGQLSDENKTELITELIKPLTYILDKNSTDAIFYSYLPFVMDASDMVFQKIKEKEELIKETKEMEI